MNSTAATLTMLGPVGVSSVKDAASPPKAAIIPMIQAVMAMTSGVRAKGRAAAAGMISIAAISSAPTTLIATATVTASASVNISCSRRGLTPLAVARSGFSVDDSNACQRQTSSAIDRTAPLQMIARSVLVTARISPNR